MRNTSIVPFLKERVSKNLRLLMKDRYEGNISLMSRRLRMDLKGVRHWIYRDCLPSAAALAIIAEETGCCVTSLLLDDWEDKPVMAYVEGSPALSQGAEQDLLKEK